MKRASASRMELQHVLDNAISDASELTGSDAASIWEFDEPNESLRILAALPAYREALRGMHLAVDAGAAGWVVRHCQSVLIPDVKMDARHYSGVDFALAFEARSLLAVPLMVGGSTLGVIEAVNKDETDYTEEDATILETLAEPAALAIHNTNLQRRIEGSFTELSDLDHLKTDFIAITSHELRTRWACFWAMPPSCANLWTSLIANSWN